MLLTPRFGAFGIQQYTKPNPLLIQPQKQKQKRQIKEHSKRREKTVERDMPQRRHWQLFEWPPGAREPEWGPPFWPPLWCIGSSANRPWCRTSPFWPSEQTHFVIPSKRRRFGWKRRVSFWGGLIWACEIALELETWLVEWSGNDMEILVALLSVCSPPPVLLSGVSIPSIANL